VALQDLTLFFARKPYASQTSRSTADAGKTPRHKPKPVTPSLMHRKRLDRLLMPEKHRATNPNQLLLQWT
jgi:hypothetical protein